MNKLVFLVSCIAALVTTNCVFAQDSTSRLKDGRAYRIDSEGQRITDHLAELEVSNREYRQKIILLERDILELKRSGSVTSGNSNQPQPSGRENCPPQRESVSINSQPSAEMCSIYTTPLQQKITRLEGFLSEENANAASAADANIRFEQIYSRYNNCLTETEQLKVEAQKMRQEADNSRHKLAGEQTLANDIITAYEARIKDMESSLQIANQRLTAAEAATRCTQESPTATANTQPSRREIEASLELAREQDNHANNRKRPETETSRDEGTNQVSHSDLTQQLNEVQSLIMKRKNSLEQQKKVNPYIDIKLTPLVSKQGRSLDSIRLAVKELGANPNVSNEQLQSLSNDIESISQQLSADIAILGRLGK